MAKDTRAIIVPFGIKGDYKIFSKNLTIKFDKPIKIENDDLEQEKERLVSLVENLMK